VGGGEAALGLALAEHAPQLHRRADALERVFTEVLAVEGLAHQQPCAGGDQHLVGLGQRLHARGEVGRLAHRGRRRVRVGRVPHHHRAAGDADAHALRLVRVDALDGLDDLQGRLHRALRVVFMRARPAEVDHQPVAEVLRDMPALARDDLAAGALVALHQRAQVFGVQTLRQRGGADQVAEHHGDLAPLGLRVGRRGECCRSGRRAARRARRAQLARGPRQLDAVAERLHTHLLELRVAQLGQQFEVDRLLLEGLGVLREAQPFEPGAQRRRRHRAQGLARARRTGSPSAWAGAAAASGAAGATRARACSSSAASCCATWRASSAAVSARRRRWPRAASTRAASGASAGASFRYCSHDSLPRWPARTSEAELATCACTISASTGVPAPVSEGQACSICASGSVGFMRPL
jgi:hypothetical protein